MELFTSEEDQPTRKEVEIDGGMLYELNGGFQKEALERLVEYSYTARLEVNFRLHSTLNIRVSSYKGH